MKNHPLSKTGIVLLSLFILGAATAFASEDCVQSLQGLKANPDMNSQIGKFGGISGMTGSWKLKGLMGAIAKTNVEFRVADEGFWVGINRDPLKQVWLCKGDKADVLKVKILKPKFVSNGMILLKASSSGQVQIASSTSGWRFMKFKKTSSPKESKAAAFIADEK